MEDTERKYNRQTTSHTKLKSDRKIKQTRDKIPMPQNLSIQPIHGAFSISREFKVGQSNNSRMLLYPLKVDNITGYSLVLDSLFFI